MRRKSARNAAKASPEKTKKVDSPTTRKTRRSKRRRKSTSSSDSEDDTSLDKIAQRIADNANDDGKEESKSHTPSDDENLSQHSVWTVTTSDEGNEGEIQKLKICLTRPSMSPEKSTRKKKGKSHSDELEDNSKQPDKTDLTRTSEDSPANQEDQKIVEDNDETIKGKGKSKTKNKSKIEKNPQLIEPENETQSEINANVQVTAQSPTIDIPVDNENDKSEVEIVASGKTDDANVQIERDIDVNEPEQEDNREVVSDFSQKTNEVVIESVENNTETTIVEENNSELNMICEQTETEDFSTCTIDTVTDEAQMCTTIEEHNVEKVQDQQVIIAEEISECKIEEQTEECNTETDIKEDKEEIVPVSEEQITSEATPEIQEAQDEKTNKEIEENSEQIENNVESEQETSINQNLEIHNEDTSTTPKETVEESDDQKITEDNEESVDRSDFKRTKITPKKRKWSNTSVFENVISNLVVINTDTIKVFCPNIEFLSESEIKLDSVPPKERRRLLSTDQTERKFERRISANSESSTKDHPDNSPIADNYEQVDNSNIIALNRKISIVDDTASKLRPPPSPAKNPTSEILFITNLVRPFTLKQLKELLERTGKIKEDGFWTDRIKSKCYVKYESVEEAEATRNAIHGVNWPIGNGKKLIIDYATEEEMENARNPPPPPVVVPEVKVHEKENQEPESKTKKDVSPPPKEKEREQKREVPIREWDLGKEDFHKERSRSRDRIKHKRPRRSRTPVEDFISKKQRKQEESTPQKLMDDLFQKTKAMPSIYWHPLSPEQIATKQQQRLLRMAEHKRRMEETSRNRGGADFGRGGVYRRRYD